MRNVRIRRDPLPASPSSYHECLPSPLPVKCPECKSSLVIEITETNNNSSSKLKNPTVQKVRSLEHEEKVPMVKSHSHSSIGE